MTGSGRNPWLASALLAAALCAPVAFAASPAAPAPGPASPAGTRSGPSLEELSEVVVSGQRPTRKVADVIPWMRRLLGEYTIEGYVDLGGRGDPAERVNARGGGVCVGFGVAPGVQCEIIVRWPDSRAADGTQIIGGISNLAPAMLLYGLEPDEVGVRYLQVDNRGLAEGATGGIVGDMVTFRAPCADVPEGCQRVTRITARPESKVIDMQVDTEIFYEVAVRYRFQFTRVKEVQAVPGPGGGSRR
jgi:hypothetical protein